MRVVVQRVLSSSVEVEGVLINEIPKGMLVLVGIEDADTKDDLAWVAGKVSRLRIFPDEEGAMNNSIIDIDGEVLSISQFTLFASTKKGNRPSFLQAGKPEFAKVMYEEFNSLLATLIQKRVKEGVFGADMQLHLVNDGPVTICIDSKNRV